MTDGDLDSETKRHRPGLTHIQPERRRWLMVAIGYISAAAVVVSVLGALAAWLVDPAAFTSFGDAVWWAIVTIGTVGYGDVVPNNTAGRTVAAILIIFSMGFFPVLTGLVTATLITARDAASGAEAQKGADARQSELLEQLSSIDTRLRQLEDRHR